MSPEIQWMQHPLYSRPTDPDKRSYRIAIIVGFLAVVVGALAGFGWGWL